MNGTRDIGRALDQWFEVGATMAPRHAVERALAIVETTPQFPQDPARAGWRRHLSGGRILAIAAAVTLLAALGVAVGAPRDQAPPAVDQSERFRSERYGYAVRHQADWVVEPATADWQVGRPWDEAPSADIVRKDIDVSDPWGAPRATVAAADFRPDSNLRVWVEAFLPTRSDRPLPDSPNVCLFQGETGAKTFQHEPPTGWTDVDIGGYRAIARASCGYIDAAVVVGPRVYVLSAFVAPENDPRSLFDTFARTLAFDRVPTPLATPAPSSAPRVLSTAPPLQFTESVTSERFGYTARIPLSWHVALASESWRPEIGQGHPGLSLTASAYLDRFIGSAARHVWGASTVLPPGVDMRTWLSDRLRPRGIGPRCGFDRRRDSPDAHTGEWVETKVGRHAALKRESCRVIDVAVADGGRIYVFTSPTSGGFLDAPTESSYLAEFLETIEFHPEDARDDP
jgi:hypothetical protein